MVTLDVGTHIVRILEVIFTCISFCLVASVGHTTDTFWTWCMFTWCFCSCVSLLILVLEFYGWKDKLPISWCDFNMAFAMLPTLMMLTASIIYPVYFTHSGNSRQIAASVISCLTCILYCFEVGLTCTKLWEDGGFLSTVPGLLKILEAFVACIIFICLDENQYNHFPGLQWCVAVYSICFIFALLVITSAICRLLLPFPSSFKKVLKVCNVLAVLMYITAVVIWPLYSFKNNPKPSYCGSSVSCPWNKLVVITFLTCFNLVAYIVDTVCCFKLTLS
ncbi:myeloid-associated differentiation marker homolog [Embiotoca jacksoni]|uniref:myeloid-associated differentiation marker homolog n=1 Tax=Embiotoca jacksoni TaxID=100190 RepID=UPI003704B975